MSILVVVFVNIEIRVRIILLILQLVWLPLELHSNSSVAFTIEKTSEENNIIEDFIKVFFFFLPCCCCYSFGIARNARKIKWNELQKKILLTEVKVGRNETFIVRHLRDFFRSAAK